MPVQATAPPPMQSKHYARGNNMTSASPIHYEIKDGLLISFYTLPEEQSPRDVFDASIADEVVAKIESGELEWFAAKVIASKCGVKLAADYLGACCYESPQAFIDAGDYYPDMVSTVIKAAKDKLKELAA